MPPTLRHERELLRKGVRLVAGVDEAGRGPLAGPVVAAAVILPPDLKFPGIRDSKKLSPAKREVYFEQITAKALCFGVGVVSERVIDEINILNATFLAMKLAIERLKLKPDHLLVDGKSRIRGVDIPQRTIIGGDDLSVSIAAASVIAKVTRDRIMLKMDALYPDWGFAKHKGYGTKRHIALLKERGRCPIHRKSFNLRECVLEDQISPIPCLP